MLNIRKLYNKFAASESKKTAILFSGASMLKTLGTLVGGILIIRWVEPQEIGLWQSFMIATSYISVLQLGVLNGLNRELPYLMGAGRSKEGEALAASAQAYALLLVAVSLLITIVVVIVHYILNGFNPLFQLSILGVGTIISMTFYHNYLSVTFRAEKAFQKLAKQYFIQFFIILISLLFVYYKKYYGLIAYYVFCEAVLTISMHRIRPVRIKPTLKLEPLKKLMSTGFLIFGLSYLQQINKSFTRIILLWTGTTFTVGLFAPASAIQVAIVTLPGIVAQYLYPKMSYIYGKTNQKDKLWSIVKTTTFGFLIFFIVIAIPIWFALPVVIERFFPKYVEGTFATQLTLITAVFTGPLIGLNSLYSIKAFKPMLIITFVKLFLFFSIPLTLTMFFQPLDGVALGNLIASFIFFIFSIWIMYKELNTVNRSKVND